MLCLPSIASVVLALGSPAPAPGDDVAERADGRPPAVRLPADGAAPLAWQPPRPPAPLPTDGVAPLGKGVPRPPLPPHVPPDGVAPLNVHTPARPPAAWMPFYVAPLNVRARASDGRPQVFAPFGAGPTVPSERRDPRTETAIRIDLLVGPIWRIRPVETLILATLEAGRRQGISGAFHVGMITAPDREFIGAHDFPIGAGFVARRRFGERSLYGSVGLSAGLLVHRAATDNGIVHRVDPDLQLPLKFAWTAGRVGLSVVLLQGFSFRTRTYERRGTEVWKRIPYRIGFAVGLHFDIGVGRAKPRPADRRRRETP